MVKKRGEQGIILVCNHLEGGMCAVDEKRYLLLMSMVVLINYYLSGLFLNYYNKVQMTCKLRAIFTQLNYQLNKFANKITIIDNF